MDVLGEFKPALERPVGNTPVEEVKPVSRPACAGRPP
jgi:hypothetical protein